MYKTLGEEKEKKEGEPFEVFNLEEFEKLKHIQKICPRVNVSEEDFVNEIKTATHWQHDDDFICLLKYDENDSKDGKMKGPYIYIILVCKMRGVKRNWMNSVENFARQMKCEKIYLSGIKSSFDIFQQKYDFKVYAQ